MVTLEDAIKAAEAGNTDKVLAFLTALEAKIEPGKIDTDAQGFILEGATQSGFDYIDDNADLLVVSARKLIEFVEPRQSLAAHIRPGMDLHHLTMTQLSTLRQECFAEERGR